MIHEHTGELTAHCLCQEGGAHRGVHTAGEGQQHLAVAHLLPDGSDGGILVVPHGPLTLGAADLVEEVADHVHPVLRVVHLRVVLDSVKATALVSNSHIGACGGMGHQGKAIRHLGHIVSMAHPGDSLLRQALEQAAGGIIEGLRLAILPGGILLGGCDLSPKGMGHQLAAVADTQNGHSQPKDLRVHMGRLLIVDAVGSSGKNDAHRIKCPDFLQGNGIGLYLTVDVALPDTAGDKLVILTAEIQHQNRLTGQKGPSFVLVSNVRKRLYLSFAERTFLTTPAKAVHILPVRFTPRPGKQCRSRRPAR